MPRNLMPDVRPRPDRKALETGEMKEKKYVREEGMDEPSEMVKQQMRQNMMDEMERRAAEQAPTTRRTMGRVFAKGGKVGSASRRADGIAQRGKTKGRII